MTRFPMIGGQTWLPQNAMELLKLLLTLKIGWQCKNTFKYSFVMTCEWSYWWRRRRHVYCKISLVYNWYNEPINELIEKFITKFEKWFQHILKLISVDTTLTWICFKDLQIFQWTFLETKGECMVKWITFGVKCSFCV